jgi:hypothetical protein
LAYKSLAHHKGANMSQGRAQLVRGLRDSPSIQRICLDALPAEIVREELGRLVAIIEDGTLDPPEKRGAVETLVGWGPHAAAAVPGLTELLGDAEQDPAARKNAALAVLNAVGLGDAMKLFGELDPNAQEPVLIALLLYVGRKEAEGGGLTAEERTARPTAQQYVLVAIRSPDTDTRRAACQAAPIVFGEEYILIRSADDFELNPAIRSAMEWMAANDPDPMLRRGAEERLDPQRLSRFVQRVLETRQRRDPEPVNRDE